MKARLLREQEITHPDLIVPGDPAATVRKRQELMHLATSGQISFTEYKQRLSIVAPPGHIIDNPEAWRLVQLGIAEPADNECIRACATFLGMTDSLQEASQRLDDAQATGLQQFDAADGEMAAAREKRWERIGG